MLSADVARIRAMSSLYIKPWTSSSPGRPFLPQQLRGFADQTILGYAPRFENIFDVLCFSVAPTSPRFGCGGVVVGFPDPQRCAAGYDGGPCGSPADPSSQQLVMSGKPVNVWPSRGVFVATPSGAPFALEPEEARIHTHTSSTWAKTMRSWDSRPCCGHGDRAPIRPDEHAGLVWLSTSCSSGREPRAFHHVFYYTAATLVCGTSPHHRNVRECAEDAASSQNSVEVAVVVDADPRALCARGTTVSSLQPHLRDSRTSPRFPDLSLRIRGPKVLSGPSGGGKHATRLLLRFRSRLGQSDRRTAHPPGARPPCAPPVYVPPHPSIFHRSWRQHPLREGRRERGRRTPRRAPGPRADSSDAPDGTIRSQNGA